MHARLHRCVQPDITAPPVQITGNKETWNPPQVEHFIADSLSLPPAPLVALQPALPDATQPQLEPTPQVGEEGRRYPIRQRRPPDRF